MRGIAPVEPSVQGGGKIAAAIARWATERRRLAKGRPEVVTRGA